MNTRCPKIFLFFVCFLFIPFAVHAGDVFPPVSSVNLDPSFPSGNDGWYLNSVFATINSLDSESGIESIFYRLNGGAWSQKSFLGTLNLVVNPSFEDALFNTWDFYGDGIENIDELEFYDGLKSVKISLDSLGVGFWSNNSRYIVADSWSNLNVSVAVLTKNISGNGAYFKVYAKTEEGDLYLGESLKLTGNNDWAILSKNFVLASDGVYGSYIKLVLDGQGSAYFDSVYMASFVDTVSVVSPIVKSGENVLEFYAVDNSTNLESGKEVMVKLDLRAPGKWNDFNVQRSGNDHTYISFINVLDDDSGLKKGSDKFQYSIDGGLTWGYYEDISKCGGNFINGGWVDLNNVLVDGQNSVTLETPVVDYCDSNWNTCKTLRFYIEDVAGRSSTRDICLFGSYFLTTGGDVYSGLNISPSVSAPDSSGDYLFLAQGNIENINSANDWIIPYYNSNISPLDFYDLLDAVESVQTVNNIPSQSGAFLINGSRTISQSAIPESVVNGLAFPAVFVDGNLTIDSNINLNNGSGIIFIVAGDVDIERRVENIDMFIVTLGILNTSYNGGSNSDPLVIKGGVVAKNIVFNRFLKQNQTSSPAELFEFDPTYLLKFSDILGKKRIVFEEG